MYRPFLILPSVFNNVGGGGHDSPYRVVGEKRIITAKRSIVSTRDKRGAPNKRLVGVEILFARIAIKEEFYSHLWGSGMALWLLEHPPLDLEHPIG